MHPSLSAMAKSNLLTLAHEDGTPKKWNRDKVRRPAFSTGEISTHHHMLLENSATGFPWVFRVGSRKESGFWVCLLTTWGCLKRYLYVSQ